VVAQQAECVPAGNMQQKHSLPQCK
jgi:hypothetical protein